MNATRARQCGGLIAIFGAGGSAGIVFCLHFVRSDYDPSIQLISELAVGAHRWAMLLAFTCLSMALLGLQLACKREQGGLVLRVALVGAGSG